MYGSMMIGPALVAAVIAALVTMIGWYVAYQRERRLENGRRAERIRDCKIALRAEISCHVPRWIFQDETGHVDEMAKQIMAGADKTPPFTPFVPKETANPAFEAIVGEIQILPGDVIEPVIRYYQQVDVIAQLAEDMRGERYAALEAERKIDVYRDFIELRSEAGRLAIDAIDALEQSSDDK